MQHKKSPQEVTTKWKNVNTVAVQETLRNDIYGGKALHTEIVLEILEENLVYKYNRDACDDVQKDP